MRSSKVLGEEARAPGAHSDSARRAEVQRDRSIVSCTYIDLVRVLYAEYLRSQRPKGTQPVSPADKDIVEQSGLAVVECSWARLDEVPFNRIASPHERLREFLLRNHPFSGPITCLGFPPCICAACVYAQASHTMCTASVKCKTCEICSDPTMVHMK